MQLVRMALSRLSVLLVIFALMGRALAQDTMGALLLYEDGKEAEFHTGENVNFLTLKRKIHSEVKHFKDFTLCSRYYFVSYREDASVSIAYWLQSSNFVKDLSRPCYRSQCMTDFLIHTFNGNSEGNGFTTFTTYPDHVSTVLQEKGTHVIFPKYVDEINAYKWHSVCLATDTANDRVYLVQNGKTNYNITQPKIWAELNDGLDTTVFEPFQTRKQWDRKNSNWMTNLTNSLWSGATLGWNHNKYSGYLADFQFFGRTLTTQEMYDVTTCKAFLKGDIYSWDADDWEPYDKELQKNEDSAVQFKTVDIPLESFCTPKQKYTFFPDMYDFLGSINLCKRFGGELADVSTSGKVQGVLKFLGKDIGENEKYDDTLLLSTYSSYTDEIEDMAWIHYESKLTPIDPLPWSKDQPDGGMAERCGFFSEVQKVGSKYTSALWDLPCNVLRPVVCEDIGEVVLKIRGLCENTRIDTTFTMVEGDKNKKRFFAGSTGWRLFWDTGSDSWRLSSHKKKNVYVSHTDFATYPLGKKYWSIVNDTCVYPNPQKVQLGISSCKSSLFSCDDGSCIPMSGR